MWAYQSELDRPYRHIPRLEADLGQHKEICTECLMPMA